MGCVLTDVVAFFIVVACAASVHGTGLKSRKPKTWPRPGTSGGALGQCALCPGAFECFRVHGLHSAAGYGLLHLRRDGLAAGIGYSFKEAPWFIALYTILIAIGAGIVLIPGAPLLGIMFWSQVAKRGAAALRAGLYADTGQQPAHYGRLRQRAGLQRAVLADHGGDDRFDGDAGGDVDFSKSAGRDLMGQHLF